MVTVGIDIGTSYSSISILEQDGKAQPVKVANGACIYGDNYSMPSAAYVDENGKIHIGQLAVLSKMKDPSRFKGEFKRDLGQQVPYQLGSLQLMPEDLYKEVFIHFKKCAEETAGEKISKAYITYPANYGKRKRSLLELTAKKAGLLEVEMIDEPTAAAYCYCTKGKIKEGDKLLVYDLGGGTFDIALIEYSNNSFNPITEALGIDKCGGIDIDRYIFEDIFNNIPTEAINMIQNNEMARNRFNAQIMELSVKIKHQLSSAESFEDMISVGFDYVEYQLTRDRLNGIIHSLVEETIAQVQKIVKKANLKMSDIDTCLLVGGTSRIPYIRERLEQLTGKPVYKDIDPELSVCMGAALWETQKKNKDVKETKKTTTKFKDFNSDAGYANGIGIEKEEKQEMYRQVKAVKQPNTDTIKSVSKVGNSNKKLNIHGNTAGNIMNFGIVAQKEDWIYYQNCSDKKKLYKIRMDGRGRTKINDDRSSNINIVGDWVYYHNHSGNGELYRIRTNGSNRTKLNNDKSWYINVVGDWVYYQNNSDAGKLYRVRTDGTNRTKLNDDNSISINIVGDWVYYSNESDGESLYKIRTDGRDRTKVSAGKFKMIIVVDGWIYFCNGNAISTLYKIRTDGTGMTSLSCVDNIYSFNVAGNWIYYRPNNDDLRLYKIRTDGTNREKLNNDISTYTCLLGDWIHYQKGVIIDKNWKVRTDGRKPTKY